MKNLESELLDLLKKFIVENELEFDEEVNNKTRLIGVSSALDSMDLVSFIVEVEQFLDSKYEIEIELANEKAMSRRTSPFISLNSLSNYINELINE